MQDFSLFNTSDMDEKQKHNNNSKPDLCEGEPAQSDLFEMKVSPVCETDGRKIAYVTFSNGIKNAEAVIPECRIIKENGFDKDELSQLEEYMRANLATLKKMASGINLLDAFMGKN